MKCRGLIYLFVALVGLGLFGCNEAERVDLPRNVVVIFEDCPKHTSTDKVFGKLSTTVATVDFVDSLCVMRSYIPRQIGRDTLVVPTYGGYAEIKHLNQVLEENYYLLEQGDTVIFTYGDNKRPRIRSLHSERNTRLYNLPEEDPRAVMQSSGYYAQTICNDRMFRMMWKAVQNPKQQKSLSRERLEEFRRICPDLDSLQSVVDGYKIDYAAELDSLEAVGALTSRYADYLRGRHLPDDFEAVRREVFTSDSLMHYPFAQRAAWQLLPERFTVDDCRRLAADTTLSPLARAAALRHAIYRMDTSDGGWKQYPTEMIADCNEIYVTLTGDATYTPEVIVGNADVANGYTNDMVLEDAAGNRSDYGDLLRSLRGKVVYVDLWASWCAPCRAEMPEAAKLRREYEGQDVAFVYLAVNDVRERWLEAVDEEKTSDASGINYLVLNAKDCKFMKEIGNRRIPQMLLYDREGRLVDTDAPRPSDNRLTEKIDELLK